MAGWRSPLGRAWDGSEKGSFCKPADAFAGVRSNGRSFGTGQTGEIRGRQMGRANVVRVEREVAPCSGWLAGRRLSSADGPSCIPINWNLVVAQASWMRRKLAAIAVGHRGIFHGHTSGRRRGRHGRRRSGATSRPRRGQPVVVCWT